jgi:hypothetical protein
MNGLRRYVQITYHDSIARICVSCAVRRDISEMTLAAGLLHWEDRETLTRCFPVPWVADIKIGRAETIELFQSSGFVLDLGCGEGRYSRLLLQRGVDALAMEID